MEKDENLKKARNDFIRALSELNIYTIFPNMNSPKNDLENYFKSFEAGRRELSHSLGLEINPPVSEDEFKNNDYCLKGNKSSNGNKICKVRCILKWTEAGILIPNTKIIEVTTRK